MSDDIADRVARIIAIDEDLRKKYAELARLDKERAEIRKKLEELEKKSNDAK